MFNIKKCSKCKDVPIQNIVTFGDLKKTIINYVKSGLLVFRIDNIYINVNKNYCVLNIEIKKETRESNKYEKTTTNYFYQCENLLEMFLQTNEIINDCRTKLRG